MDAVVQWGSPTAAFTVQEGTDERGAMEAPGNTECHVCVSSVRPMSPGAPMESWSEVRRGVQCVQIMHLMVYGLLNITRILQML